LGRMLRLLVKGPWRDATNISQEFYRHRPAWPDDPVRGGLRIFLRRR